MVYIATYTPLIESHCDAAYLLQGGANILMLAACDDDVEMIRLLID